MKIREFNIVKIGLELSREELYRNINTRVDNMIEQGLVEEVKNLLHYRDLNALQTVGYKEVFDFLIPKSRLHSSGETYSIKDSNITLEKAIQKIKQNTRQYAKRQLTWFRKDEKIKWIKPDDIEKIKQAVSKAWS